MEIVRGIKGILLEVERAREDFSHSAGAQRSVRRASLLGTIERLANLVALALSREESAGLEAKTRAALGECLQDLRSRVSALSKSLAMEALRRLRRKAGDILDNGEFPLGASVRLRERLNDITSGLLTIGGDLSADEIAEIDAIITIIGKLEAIERSLPFARDLR